MTSWNAGMGWLVLGLMLFIMGCETAHPPAMASHSSPLPSPISSPSPFSAGPIVSTPVAVQSQPGKFPLIPTANTAPAFFREMPGPGPLPHGGGGTPLPFPQPGDKSLEEGTAYVVEAWLEYGNNRDGEILHLRGSLPTPCHSLRVSTENHPEQNQFFVRVYSVYAPKQMCVQVLQSFEVEIPLNLSEGIQVLVNGHPVPRR